MAKASDSSWGQKDSRVCAECGVRLVKDRDSFMVAHPAGAQPFSLHARCMGSYPAHFRAGRRAA